MVCKSLLQGPVRETLKEVHLISLEMSGGLPLKMTSKMAAYQEKDSYTLYIPLQYINVYIYFFKLPVYKQHIILQVTILKYITSTGRREGGVAG